jgi:hypothetical protein
MRRRLPLGLTWYFSCHFRIIPFSIFQAKAQNSNFLFSVLFQARLFKDSRYFLQK